MSFSNIPLFLLHQVDIDKYKIEIPKHLNEYNLCITGNIGVGKSTTLEFIKLILKLNKININLFPEYIQTETGKLMFELFNGQKITPIVFQNYILDNWIELYDRYSKLIYTSFKINLYERFVEDSVKCFGKNSLNKSDYEYLLSRYNTENKNYHFLEYKECEIVGVENDDIQKTIEDVINIINSDLKNNVKNRVVKLYTTVEKNEERIQQRNRHLENTCVDYNILNYYDELI